MKRVIQFTIPFTCFSLLLAFAIQIIVLLAIDALWQPFSYEFMDWALRYILYAARTAGIIWAATLIYSYFKYGRK